MSFIILGAIWLHPILSFGDSAVPDGFRIDTERGHVHITKQIAQQINYEVVSTNRIDYIEHYISMLSSDDVTNRMFAIYALGNFQSLKSLDALFIQVKNEKNPQAICALADSVYKLFPYWPSAGEDSEKWECQRVLKQWAQYYEQHSYLGIFEVKYAAVKGNLEAEAAFVIGFATDRPSPDLIPFYQNTIKQTSFSKIRNACQKAIDSLSIRR